MDKTDFSLVVSPVLTRIKVYDNLVSASVKIKNTTSKDVTLKLQLRPFTSSPTRDGSISFTNQVKGPDKLILKKIKIFEGENAITCKTGVDCSLKLLPFEEKTLNLKLDLGSKIQSGDYYFSLLFISNSVAGRLRTYSKVESGIASNFLLSVKPAEANLPAGRQELTKVNISSPILLIHGPVNFKVLVTNDSNQLLNTGGNIFIKDMFGHLIGKVYLPNRYVLGNSSRYLNSGNTNNISKGIGVLQDTQQTASWNEKFLLGVYTAKVEISEKENNQISASETTFVAIPTFLLMIIALLAFVIGGIYLRVKKKI